MHEYKHGALHSGSSKAPAATSRKPAVTSALSEQRQPASRPSASASPRPNNLGKYLHPKKGR